MRTARCGSPIQRAIEPESPAPEDPASDQTRLEPILDAIAALARRDLGARAPVSLRGDLIDAVAAGVNKLGEELAAASAGVERRVRERTSELARTNLELARRALYDPLTELPNRALYEDRLGHLLAGIQGRGGRLSVLSLEVDRFAELSQTLGHASVETLLVEVAGRVRRTVRPTDTASRFRDGHLRGDPAEHRARRRRAGGPTTRRSAPPPACAGWARGAA
jgi:hypothetical protein